MDKKGKVVLDKSEENPLSKFLRRSKHYVCSFPSHALLNSDLAGGKMLVIAGVNVLMFDQKVLVVDDETDIVRLLQTVLIKEGIDQVYTAGTAEARWVEFQKWRPNLVILDIMLPDGEGYEVCKKIRAVQCSDILLIGQDGRNR